MTSTQVIPVVPCELDPFDGRQIKKQTLGINSNSKPPLFNDKKLMTHPIQLAAILFAVVFSGGLKRDTFDQILVKTQQRNTY